MVHSFIGLGVLVWLLVRAVCGSGGGVTALRTNRSICVAAGQTVAVLVLEAGPARTPLVATDPGSGNKRSSLHAEHLFLGPPPLLGGSQRPFPLVEAPFSSVEVLGTRSESTLQLSAGHRPVAPILIDDGPEFVENQSSNCSSHRDPNGVAVPPPRRPHRIRHRDLHQLHAVGVVELGENAPVDLGKGSTIKGHRSPPPVYWYTPATVLQVRVLKRPVRTETRDRVDGKLERTVLPAGTARRAISRFDLVHVTDCEEGPLPQSWRNIEIQTLHGESGFFVAGEISAVTDTGCVLHCARVDATTLSAECQQPCQPNHPRVAVSLESVAQQRFSQHRRVFERNLFDPTFLGRLGSLPRIRQPCAKGPIRRSQPRTRRRRDERPVINPPTGNGPTRTKSNSNSLAGRPRRTLSPECQQPSHENVNNPVRNPPTAGQRQRPRTRTPPPRRRHPREENIEMTLC